MTPANPRADIEVVACPDCNGPLDRVRPEFTALPEAMQDLTFQTWRHRDDVAPAVEAAKEFAEGSASFRWLVFAGSYGWGKTGLAVAILNYRAEHPEAGPPGKYVRAPQLLDDLKTGFVDNTSIAKLRTYQEVGLLLIDDLGAQYGTDWADERLYELIDHRYVNRMQTIITTNTKAEKMEPRILDRFLDTGTGLCVVFDYTVPSYRTGEVREVR